MDSRSFYRVLYGYDVENHLTLGVRYCAIIIKSTESLQDDLLVKYSNHEKRRVSGMYLFTDKEEALKWIERKRMETIEALEFKIREYYDEIDTVNLAYSQISVEEPTTITF